MKRNLLFFLSLLIIYNIITAAGCKKDDVQAPLPDNGTVTDVEGNTYKTVKIGTQVWMAENLKVTKFRNGADIPFVSSGQDWANLAVTKLPGCCNSTYGSVATIGKLYNWPAVNDSRNLAPAGWHVPSLDEWLTLMNALGGKPVAGGKMKETGTTHWPFENNLADNSSGFTARYIERREYQGVFRVTNQNLLGNETFWWTSTGNPNDITPKGMWASVNSKHAGAATNGELLNTGLPVRCVKD